MGQSENSVETKVTMERAAFEVPEDPPFHILFLADFSGQKNTNFNKSIEIDRDIFAEVMSVISPRVSLTGDQGSSLLLQFKSLDDFHPDTLFQNVSLFDDLRSLRERLLDERGFDNAAREVRSWFSEGEQKVEVEEAPIVEGGDGLLADILGSESRDASAYKPAKSAELKDFVSKIVDPHLVRIDENEQSRLIEAVDEATSGLMRMILADSGYKSMEATWRGLYYACRNIETDSKLKLFLVDASKEDFIEDLKNEDGGPLADLLLSGRNKNPWALICGAYDFGFEVDDIAALMRVAGIAGIVNGPFVSHIRPGMLGIRGFGESPDMTEWDVESETSEGKLWTVLRGSPDAASLGLIMPRLLSRLPYGKDTDPAETFEFEEISESVSHDDLLWMNPVFGFAVAMANSFIRRGWEMGGRYELDLTGLPMHVFQENGATLTKPCAEFHMTDQALELLLEQGVIPMASFKDTDRVRVGGVQSVMFPIKALKGRWS